MLILNCIEQCSILVTNLTQKCSKRINKWKPENHFIVRELCGNVSNNIWRSSWQESFKQNCPKGAPLDIAQLTPAKPVTPTTVQTCSENACDYGKCCGCLRSRFWVIRRMLVRILFSRPPNIHTYHLESRLSVYSNAYLANSTAFCKMKPSTLIEYVFEWVSLRVSRLGTW